MWVAGLSHRANAWQVSVVVVIVRLSLGLFIAIHRGSSIAPRYSGASGLLEQSEELVFVVRVADGADVVIFAVLAGFLAAVDAVGDDAGVVD